MIYDNPTLFCGGVQYPYRKLSKIGIKVALKKYKNITNIRVYSHKIRHTTATPGLKYEMLVTNLQTLLGYVKLEIIMIYVYLADKDVKYIHSKYII